MLLARIRTAVARMDRDAQYHVLPLLLVWPGRQSHQMMLMLELLRNRILLDLPPRCLVESRLSEDPLPRILSAWRKILISSKP